MTKVSQIPTTFGRRTVLLKLCGLQKVNVLDLELFLVGLC